MAKQNVWVVRHPEGWAVKREGASRASFVTSTKQEAEQLGRTIAQNQHVELITQNRHGGGFKARIALVLTRCLRATRNTSQCLQSQQQQATENQPFSMVLFPFTQPLHFSFCINQQMFGAFQVGAENIPGPPASVRVSRDARSDRADAV